MLNTTSPYFYPNDSWSDHNHEHSHETLSKLPLKAPQDLKKDHVPLYPIDETDDFHDPFSDLSLFLSRQIKKVVEQSGSTKQWSAKIQTDLMKSILPEFTIRFPKYRIGLAAIRKVFEKVSYFYSKVHTHKEALRQDGQLNIDYMIKENLKNSPQQLNQDLPFYHHAHQLAVRLCECIATVDGIRPSLDHLTKVIWATQKHLLKDLPLQKTKNAFEEYDFLDKILVKAQLEHLACHPLSTKDELTAVLKNAIGELKELSQEHHYESLYQELAFLLSEKLQEKLGFTHLLSGEDHKHFKIFIQRQLDLCEMSSRLKPETKTIETVQRVLSLYPLATSFAKYTTEGELKQAIQDISLGSYHKKKNDLSPMIITFIQAELHFLKRKNNHATQEELQQDILKTFQCAKNLPQIEELDLTQLEVYVWNVIRENKSLEHISSRFIEKEVTLTLIDQPKLGFKTLMYQLMQHFLKAFEILKNEEFAKDFEHRLERKIHIWTVQHSMVFRSIHFDEQLELFKLLISTWQEERLSEKLVCHQRFTLKVLQAYLDKHPELEKSQDILSAKIQLFYQYFWYHGLLKDSESSLDRFILWHAQDIRSKHSEMSADERAQIFEKRLQELLPLTPYSRKILEEAIA